MCSRTSKLVTRAHLWAIVGCVLLRLALLPLQGWLTGRLELITRSRSWERANEVAFMQRNGLDPFHGMVDSVVSPALLLLRAISPSKYGPNGEWLSSGWLSFIIFAVVDILTGILLSQNSSIILQEEEPMLGEKARESLMKEKMKPNVAETPFTAPKRLPLTIFCLYVLNPLTAALCVARGGDSIGYLMLGLSLWTLHNGMAFFSGIAIALCTLCYDARAMMLIISAVTLPHWGGVYKGLRIDDETAFRKKEDPTLSGVMAAATTTANNSLFTFRLWKLTSCLAGFSLAFGLAAVVAWASTESFNPALSLFMESIAVQDLSPNVGLQWYLFQLTFTDFRVYFGIILGWHMLAYMGPLTIRMAGDMPHACMDVVAMIVIVFRPCPSFADLMVLLCLGNAHPRILGRMNWLTFMTFGIGVPMTLIPIVMHMWLVSGTGNANFVFGGVMAYNAFLCLGVLQFINGAMKRRKALQLAIKPRHKNDTSFVPPANSNY